MNGSLFCGSRQRWLSPKGDSDKAMNEHVMSVTWSAWAVSLLPRTPPAPSPHRSFFAASSQPRGFRKYFYRVDQRMQSTYQECRSWAGGGGECSRLPGKSVFHMGEKCYGYWICISFMPGKLKEGKNQSPALPSPFSSWPASIHPFFSWGKKKKKKNKSKSNVRTWGQILKWGERK